MNKKQNQKDAIMYGLLALGTFAIFQVNQSLKRHVQSCEESSKNLRRVVWLVLGAVITEIVIKLIDGHVKL